MTRSLTLIISITSLIILSSHELFLKTDSHFLKSGQPSILYLFNGTFDTSENTITRDRIVNAKVIGPDFEYHPEDSDYYDEGNATFLRIKPEKAGTYVAGISTLSRMIELNAAEFKEYLEHEELNELIARREKKGISDQSASEKYSKHVKAILQVDKNKTNHYEQKLGYPIEFVPLQNPFEVKPGDDLSFRLLLDGKPLSDQTVHFSHRNPNSESSNDESSSKTDKDGVVTIPVNEIGKWYIATIHITESTEKGIDYESNWATLTFEIR